jgi:hypothetical protein
MLHIVRHALLHSKRRPRRRTSQRLPDPDVRQLNPDSQEIPVSSDDARMLRQYKDEEDGEGNCHNAGR